MHRLILGLEHGDKREGDHEDGNGLDNRRSCNLRIATHQQNTHNQRSLKGMSKFKGVRWHRRHKRWEARIRVNYKLLHIGSFVGEKDAARAYDRAALRHHGIFAKLNFPG